VTTPYPSYKSWSGLIFLVNQRRIMNIYIQTFKDIVNNLIIFQKSFMMY